MSIPYDHLIKVNLIGDAGSGQKNLLSKFADDGQEDHFVSTIGCDFKSCELDAHGQKVRLQIWDTAGQEGSFKITSSYYRGAKGIFLIYDVTSEKSFHNIKEWMKNISEASGEGVMVILLGNRCHLKNDERQVSWERGRSLAQELDIKFFEVSAHTGTNIKEALQTIVNDILAKKPSVTDSQKTDMQKSRCIVQ